MIEINRNSIVVRNVDFKSKEYKKAQFRFSLYDTVTHKYSFSVFSIIKNDIYFPASIGIGKILECFPNKRTIETFQTTAKPKKAIFKIIHEPRDELQEKALSFLLKIKQDNFCRERFLSLPTGSGKTYVTINLASKLKMNTMIIVDTLDLASQWKKEILKHSNVKDTDIRILSGLESIEDAEKTKNGKFFIAIHRTLSNLISEDENRINSLMNKLGIGFRVFDESHVNFKNICNINSFSNVEYTLYLTATPGRSKFNENSLYGKVFGSIPYFNGKDIFSEKYHTVLLYKIDSKPSIQWKAKIKTKYGFNSARWSEFIINNSFSVITDAIEKIFLKLKLQERDKKIAIMLPTLEMIDSVEKFFKDKFPEIEVGKFIGTVQKNKREQELNKHVILTNDKIFDKGIDVSDLEILINFVQLGSSVKIEQIIGRLRYGENKSSILIDIADFGFDETIKQFKLRKRFYKKKAKKILEFN